MFVAIEIEIVAAIHSGPGVKKLDVSPLSVVAALLKPQIRVLAQGLAVMPYFVC